MAKKIWLVVLMVVLLLSVSACGKANDEADVPSEENNEAEAVEEDAEAEAAEAEAEEADSQAGSGTIVIYFSATGTTKGIAEKIAAVTGADIYEIVPAEEYTSEDLNWNDSNSRTSIEQNDPVARPEIASDPVSLDAYDTVYIGYPIWWGVSPRIMETFVEGYDFDGKTVIPFCTSGSSGIGNSGKNLAELAGKGNWLEGKRFGAGASEDEIREWVTSLR